MKNRSNCRRINKTNKFRRANDADGVACTDAIMVVLLRWVGSISNFIY